MKFESTIFLQYQMNNACYGLYFEGFRRQSETSYRCLITCMPPLIHAHFGNILEFDSSLPLAVQTSTLGTVYYPVRIIPRFLNE